jgi:hypothetical protein
MEAWVNAAVRSSDDLSVVCILLIQPDADIQWREIAADCQVSRQLGVDAPRQFESSAVAADAWTKNVDGYVTSRGGVQYKPGFQSLCFAVDDNAECFMQPNRR